MYVYLNAEEEEDPLVVHVVDHLVLPCVERSQAWLGSRQQLLRHIGPERIQCYTKKSKDSAIQDHNGVL